MSLSKYSLLSTALAVSQAAYAQTPLNLEPVQVTGLRPIPLDSSVLTVTILGPDELAVRSSPFIADQLRSIPGIAVSRNGSVGGLTQVRTRGSEANHTLSLINGFEISDPTTGETNFGLLSVLPVERLEAFRGEQSGLYG
jgi:vitamin B12 transporter